ncbi:MAG: sensor histidine kinase [Roseburia sp.]
MKRNCYSNLCKTLVGIAEVICAVVFVMSCFLLVTLNKKNIINMERLTDDEYVDSSYYSSVFQDKLDGLIQYLRLRQEFETDGVYNPGKVINISGGGGKKQMEDTEELSAYDMQCSYVLSDLIVWSKSGYVMYEGKIQEDYLPISGISISDSVSMNILTEEEANQLYQQLQAVLDRIGQEESLYRKGLNSFDGEKTNLTYMYIEAGKVVYTNMENAAPSMDLLAYGKEQGSYFYASDDTLVFRSNVEGIEDYYYQSMEGNILGLGRQSTFLVAVDTGFAENDDFTEARKEFVTLHPWGLASLILLIVSLMGWLFSFVYLTLAAGRKETDELVHLNLVDWIKTEFLVLGFVVFSVLTVILIAAAIGYDWDVAGMMVVVGSISFLYNGIFLIFYLSMIRRMKAGALWENSFTRWVLVSVKRIINTWKSSVQVIVTLGINVVVLCALSYGTFGRRLVWCAVLLLLQLAVVSVLLLRDRVQKQEILKGIHQINEGDLSYKIPMEHMHDHNRKLAEAINSIGGGLQRALEDKTKNERMKANLITNVSHDIKTPLTSIINYVNLMKMEKVENERMANYIQVLEEKASRLRQLTEDLVEASRISTGAISLQMTRINLVELIYQTGGEFVEKFEARSLTTVTKLPNEPVVIMADGRRIWRVLENLYNNVAKYAMVGTRVYVTLEVVEGQAVFFIKNISEQPLQHTDEELKERFVRGDESRSTEGSGLGLSIADNLTVLMGGQFIIELDGDLFTAKVVFPVV